LLNLGLNKAGALASELKGREIVWYKKKEILFRIFNQQT